MHFDVNGFWFDPKSFVEQALRELYKLLSASTFRNMYSLCLLECNLVVVLVLVFEFIKRYCY